MFQPAQSNNLLNNNIGIQSHPHPRDRLVTSPTNEILNTNNSQGNNDFDEEFNYAHNINTMNEKNFKMNSNLLNSDNNLNSSANSNLFNVECVPPVFPSGCVRLPYSLDCTLSFGQLHMLIYMQSSWHHM